MTGQETRIAEQFNSETEINAIVPMRIRCDKEDGRWVEKRIRMLPGYVFLSGENAEEIWKQSKKQAVHLLHYGEESNDFNLIGQDRVFAQWMFEHDGVIGVSKVINEGDQIRVVEGPLKDMEAVIERFDKRKRIALVTLKISKIKAWLSFDWIE